MLPYAAEGEAFTQSSTDALRNEEGSEASLNTTTPNPESRAIRPQTQLISDLHDWAPSTLKPHWAGDQAETADGSYQFPNRHDHMPTQPAPFSTFGHHNAAELTGLVPQPSQYQQQQQNAPFNTLQLACESYPRYPAPIGMAAPRLSEDASNYTRAGASSSSITPLAFAADMNRISRVEWDGSDLITYIRDVKGIKVVRRADGLVNGTKLLNCTNMTRGRRDGILKNEKQRFVIKAGSHALKGVWIPLERARDLATRHALFEDLWPLLEEDIESHTGGDPYPSPAASSQNPSAPSVPSSSSTGTPFDTRHYEPDPSTSAPFHYQAFSEQQVQAPSFSEAAPYTGMPIWMADRYHPQIPTASASAPPPPPPLMEQSHLHDGTPYFLPTSLEQASVHHQPAWDAFATSAGPPFPTGDAPLAQHHPYSSQYLRMSGRDQDRDTGRDTLGDAR